jgi:hypothetical protein
VGGGAIDEGGLIDSDELRNTRMKAREGRVEALLNAPAFLSRTRPGCLSGDDVGGPGLTTLCAKICSSSSTLRRRRRSGPASTKRYRGGRERGRGTGQPSAQGCAVARSLFEKYA